MHFPSLCSLIILVTATHLVGAYNPVGKPCDTPGTFKNQYELHIPTDLILCKQEVKVVRKMQP
jgi:hypothetical protein